jgi:hypothetical protein
MSLFDTVKDFATELFKITNRVAKNAEDIRELRQDLEVLAGFSRKVANVVKQNQAKIEFSEKQVTKDHENLVLKLKVELYELERRLSLDSRRIAQPTALVEENSLRPSLESSDASTTL